MAIFNYVAFSAKGKRVEGTHEADTREQVADYLHTQSLTVISVNENLTSVFQKIGSIQIGKMAIKDRVIFAKQLSIMLTASVPVVQALRILTEQTKNQAIKEKLKKIYTEVEAGSKLSEAFAKDNNFFNAVQLNLIAAGEKSGNLNKMLTQVADDLEKSKNLAGKIRGAMIYPAIILVVLIIVMAIVVIFMVPSVKNLYADLGGGELPAITQFLVEISNFFTHPLGIISTVIVVIFSVMGFRYYRQTTIGRYNIDKLILRIPVFGTLTAKIQVAQFCRLLSMLLKSGVSIVEALTVVSKAMPNVLFQQAIAFAADEVIKGIPLSVPLTTNGVFPDILLRIIATGEDTGNLDNVLVDMGKFYSAEVDEISNNLTKLMEPLILLIVGGMVAFIAIAVYLPIYSIGQFVS
jgi:type IV pilus assembly protein PilC